MSVYIEYISRRSGVALNGFHAIAGPGQGRWAGQYPEDRLILNIGRTWRLGPEPEYLAVWHTPGKGVERLGEWEEIFGSGEASHIEDPFDAVGRIDVAGFYEPFLDPVRGSGPVYYAEYFDWAADATVGGVRSFFEKRRSAHSGLVLNLAADRIGKLGPDPRGVAFWQLQSYRELGPVARELDGPGSPIVLVRAGVYADIGQEIL